MDFILINHDMEHAIQTAIQVFHPNEGYKRLTEPSRATSPYVVSERDGVVFRAFVYDGGAVVSAGESTAGGHEKRDLTQAAANAVYDALSGLSGYRPPWGTLTGVRPAKIASEMMARGVTDALIKDYLRRAYRVRDDKAALCVDVARAETLFLSRSEPDDAGVYIGIPFCPTRCKYCSFSSYPLARYAGMRGDYLAALLKELDFLGSSLRASRVRAVYIGGGTPTALDAGMLDALLTRVGRYFGRAPELTVEAGRPDSIDRDKLSVLKSHGVTRLAINPQTMDAETLKRVGRNHTPADFLRAAELARGMGFDNINHDVILGLPGEDASHARRTFAALSAVAPESLTVHTLALKRAAELNHDIGRYGSPSAPDTAGAIGEMLDIAAHTCLNMGLKPYYMYRQKNMVGNFENVGYALPGYECDYNHQTMTEARSVYAIGAGAVTKVLFRDKNLIKRAFNVKTPDEYIARIDEMIERKQILMEEEDAL